MLRARVDGNQNKIVKELRALGVCVEPKLSRVGSGVPDLLIGYRGRNYLVELKNSDQSPSRKRLTPDEDSWHDEWKGQVEVCETLDEILNLIGLSRSK